MTEFDHFLIVLGISCTSIAMESLVPGNSRITVQYKNGVNQLEQTVSIAAYRRLKLFNPDLRTILALGTHRNLIFTGNNFLMHSYIFDDFKINVFKLRSNIIFSYI